LAIFANISQLGPQRLHRT